MIHVYGMRLRGFSLGCQPKEGFVERCDDPLGRYWDILIYDRMLSHKELRDYDLDELPNDYAGGCLNECCCNQ